MLVVTATPPASTKASLGQRLSARARARDRWSALHSVQVRFRGRFAYITGELTDGEVLPLCRLRYSGSASTWGFAIYRAWQPNASPTNEQATPLVAQGESLVQSPVPRPGHRETARIQGCG